MGEHDFCRALLRDSRAEAKGKGVKLPKRITALRSSGVRGQFFVETGVRSQSRWVTADCAYHARSIFISQFIDEETADYVPLLP